jgi:hypothetical protein
MARSQIKVNILGRSWKVSVIDGDAFLKRFGEALDGICMPELLEIVYCADDLNLETVVHELVHGWYAGLCTGTTELSGEQMEEIFAEMFSRYGAQILKAGEALYKELKDKA